MYSTVEWEGQENCQHNSLQINFLEYDVITEINTLNK